MTRNIEQINEILLREIGAAISKEIALENGFISISYVKCAPDLISAEVGVTVIPDNKKGSALKRLRQANSIFSQSIRKNTRLRRVPRLNWVIDNYDASVPQSL